MSSAIMSPHERYPHDAAFKSLVDALSAAILYKDWGLRDINDAWNLAWRNAETERLNAEKRRLFRD